VRLLVVSNAIRRHRLISISYISFCHGRSRVRVSSSPHCRVNLTSLWRSKVCTVFGISRNAGQKRCQAVTQIMKAKSPWIIIYQSAFVVSVR
jgi:hypothetical protein